jgi:hypothetical protein
MTILAERYGEKSKFCIDCIHWYELKDYNGNVGICRGKPIFNQHVIRRWYETCSQFLREDQVKKEIDRARKEARKDTKERTRAYWREKLERCRKELETVKAREQSLRKYVNNALKYWREKRENPNAEQHEISFFYIDAFASVRATLDHLYTSDNYTKNIKEREDEPTRT